MGKLLIEEVIKNNATLTTFKNEGVDITDENIQILKSIEPSEQNIKAIKFLQSLEVDEDNVITSAFPSNRKYTMKELNIVEWFKSLNYDNNKIENFIEVITGKKIMINNFNAERILIHRLTKNDFIKKFGDKKILKKDYGLQNLKGEELEKAKAKWDKIIHTIKSNARKIDKTPTEYIEQNMNLIFKTKRIVYYAGDVKDFKDALIIELTEAFPNRDLSNIRDERRDLYDELLYIFKNKATESYDTFAEFVRAFTGMTFIEQRIRKTKQRRIQKKSSSNSFEIEDTNKDNSNSFEIEESNKDSGDSISAEDFNKNSNLEKK